MDKKLTLNEIGLRTSTDKSSFHHNYLELYDKYFSEYRYDNINFLEIGVLFGHSISVFHQYFENGFIYGLDIEDRTHLNNERVKIITGDQTDEHLLNNFNEDFFSIIIDDGSHQMYHQQKTFGLLFSKLRSKGIYVIEDLHTSFDEYIETTVHGKGLFGIESDNRTVDFLNGFINGNKHNKYLSEEQYNYLINHIESIEIIETSRKSNNIFSITSIIRKK